MKRLLYMLMAVVAAVSGPAHAVPAPASRDAPQDVYMPFDPPLGEPLRYRWEKTRARDGRTETAWSISSHVFEKHGDGFKLTVTPIGGGSNEIDPRKLELERKYRELTDFPFVLTLDSDGSILALEKSDVYWGAIGSAIETYAKTAPADQAAGIAAMAKLVADVPEEARLGLLTESVQPLLEFGDTELTTGEPVAVDLETASLWGGTYKSRAVVTLAKVVGDVASISITTTVPREELIQIAKSFGEKVTHLPAGRREEMAAAIASLKDFRHETRSSYSVSIVDGMLQRFESTETVALTEGGGSSRSLTTRSLVPVD